jgi:hypothetical protein
MCFHGFWQLICHVSGDKAWRNGVYGHVSRVPGVSSAQSARFAGRVAACLAVKPLTELMFTILP